MDDRISQLQTMLSEQPHDCFLHHALALEFMKRSEYSQAEKHFLQNLSNDPAYLATYYQLAKLQQLLGKEEDAIKTYEQGMLVAKKQDNQHTYSELRSALEELTF